MSKRHHKTPQLRPREAAKPGSVKLWWIAAIAVLAVGGALLAMKRTGNNRATGTNLANLASISSPTNAKPTALPTPEPPNAATNAIPAMEAAQSVVVTHDLDYGSQRPSLAGIMHDIERRHQADDGLGRTFAILEAF